MRNEVNKVGVKPSGRDFNLMVLGQIISILGSALLRFALSLYVLDITGRADMFAALFAISNIPMVLAPFGGAIADRFNRRNLMVIYDFCSSFIVFVLFMLMASDSASVVLIGVIMVLLSTISAMYTPTVTASIPLLVSDEKIESANGIVTAVQALSGVAAPILGGFLYVIRQSFIRKAMILAAMLNLILSPLMIVGAPIVFRQTMQSTDTMYGVGMGLIQCATIAGALMVGLLMKWLKMRTVYRWMLGIAVLLIPMVVATMPFMVGFGFLPAFSLFMIGAVAISAILTMLSVYLVSKVQKVTPNESLGKVMAIIMGVAQCAAPVGQVIYGVLFETFKTNVYLPILLISAVMLGIAVVSRRSFKHEDDALVRAEGSVI